MSSQSSIARFLKHSGIYAVGNLINRLGAFVLLPVYTQQLTVSNYGALELFYSFSAVVFGIISIGIAHATLRFYFEFENVEQRKVVISSGYIFAAMISILALILVYPFSDRINIVLFGDVKYKYAILLVLLTIIFELTSQVCLAYIRAIEKSLMFVYLSLLKLVIQVSVNATLVLLYNGNVEEILLGNLSAVFVSWFVLSYFTIKNNGIKMDIEMVKKILNYSYPFLFGTILSLVSTNFDKFSLNYLDTIGAVGIYMLAFKFAQVIESLIGEPFNRSYGSYRFSIMRDSGAADIQARIFNYLFYTIVLVSLGLSLFVDNILEVMSTKEFWNAAIYTPLVLCGTIFRVIAYPMQTGILYAKKTGNLFYISLAALLVNVTANLILIPVYGVAGACIAFVLSEFVNALLTGIFSHRHFKVRYRLKGPTFFLICAVLLYMLNSFALDLRPIYDLLLNVISLILMVTLLFTTKIFLDESEIVVTKEKINLFIAHFRSSTKNV